MMSAMKRVNNKTTSEIKFINVSPIQYKQATGFIIMPSILLSFFGFGLTSIISSSSNGGLLCLYKFAFIVEVRIKISVYADFK